MPLLDVVTDVLFDPDFIDVFSVTRASQTMTTGGMAEDTSTVVSPVYGVVEAPNDSNLAKFPEGESLHGSIVIHTTFRLTAGQGSSDFDIVTWNGRTYQVVDVSDWSRYGQGYIEAVCTLNKVSP